MNVVGTSAFLFGGIHEIPDPDAPEDSGDTISASSKELFRLQLVSGDGMEWERVRPAGEDVPLARWKHTATVFDNTQLIFFGGFHTSEHRLNDVWVFDAVAYAWRQPNKGHNQDCSQPFQLAQSVWANSPSPRGGHTATLIGDLLYIFGGYGGLGYSRRDLDDLFALNLVNWTWTRINAKGTPPEKRTGHQAAQVDKKIYIFGGSNSTTQFNDLHMLDTEADPPLWTKLSCDLAEPTWNLAACSVIAIPTWKIFTFGGLTGLVDDKNRLGVPQASARILDTGSGRWMTPQIEGKSPVPRSDTCMTYDSKGSRLFVFGGWSTEWHGDLYTLDVGNIVGPPYAITDMDPHMGPVTGGTEISIIGIDFINTQDVVIRFGNAKQGVDVQGVYVSQTKILCTSPDFTKFPTGVVDVRVALDGDSFTTTYQRFSFFSVTNAPQSIMFGPGLISGCTINEETCFVIQARDADTLNRTTGGDEFSVVVSAFDEANDGALTRLAGVRVNDMNNGTYLVTYTVKHPGKYKVEVDFMGTFGGEAGPVRGSGDIIEFDAKAPRENNRMSGQLIQEALKKDIEHLERFTASTSKAIFVRVRDDSWSNEEQIRVLMNVKESLIKAQTAAKDTTLLVDRSECIISYLREQDVTLPGLERALADGKAEWEKILREMPQISNKISPMMRAHGGKIRNDIAAYETHVKGYLEKAQAAEYILYATGATKSIQILDAADTAHEQQLQVMEKMKHIANVFECLQDMDGPSEVIAQVGSLLNDYRTLWNTAMQMMAEITQAKSLMWAGLDVDALEDISKNLVMTLRKLPKTVRPSDAFKGLDKTCKEFVVTVPILVSLRSPAMRERHWRELMDVVKKEFTLPNKNPQMTLRDLLEMELHVHSNDVEEIAEKALKEAKHEEILKQLDVTWTAVNFSMTFYKDTDVPLLRLEDEQVETLESDQMSVQSIVGGRYGHFKAEASEWQRSLGLVSDIVQLIGDIQRTWSYLEPLFIGSEEVKRELPEDAARFSDIDSQVRLILQKAWKTRNVKLACQAPGLMDKLQALEVKQDLCKKSLSEFLDGKRRQFPRFYFMSEADLLDLLSNSSQPTKVLVQVDKILLTTAEIRLERAAGADRPLATHWLSGVGKEVVKFDPVVKLTGKAEAYLLSLLLAQIFTLSKCLSASMARYPTKSRVEWMMQKDSKGESLDPSQIVLLVAAIDFARTVEAGMNKDIKSIVKIADLTKTQLADLIKLTQSPLSKPDRQRVMCMITLDAHNRDILEILVRENVILPSDFQWQSKLRPRFKTDVAKGSNVTCTAEFKICDAAFDYGFEYLGNGPRLVVTPLTDRIYVTATQALNLKMGCAPAGPAGTGKTETTKDLANALGKCCYVFNCSPEMDFQSMGDIFKGLAASGSWGCFDEFNRLIPEVLSVCSVQFKSVCDALKAYDEKKDETHKVTVEGDTVALDPTCGAFITMNPGYLGRSELPEGLKALFRPITVVVPDLVLICENMLMAEGFLTAKLLASKFYGLYTLLSELLSKQMHYDWGLRAVKSVLVVAGMLKRAEPNLAEDALLMRALRDFNIPKIVQADEVVFFGLLNDLFPELNPPRVFDEELSECVTVACESAGLWPDPFFTLKVMQLDELLDIRHCVFIMGPPGAGKSTTWKMLQAAKTKRNPDQKVMAKDLNPKVMPTEDLYGHISMASREWKDGLLSCIMRDVGRIPDEKPKWIILDGDLDANWIESMNSVMDDNKMLTLASNERIPLKHYMRMIFEIRDLKYATPATVSRAGILYISTDGGSQWRSIIGSWVRGKPETLFEDQDREKIHDMFTNYVPDCLRYFVTYCQSVVQMNDISIVCAVCRLLDTVLTRQIVTDDAAFETNFVFCLIWGIGSVLTISDDGTDHRKAFSDWFRAKFNKQVKIPSRDTIFDYWLDNKTNKFDSWKSSPAFGTVDFDSSVMNMAEITVPTAETASVLYWMDQLVKNGSHVMLAGPAGTGKTALVNGMLGNCSPEAHIHTTVNMNFYTSAAVLLTSLEAPLQKRTGSTFGPPGGAKMIYFIDDLNLPEVDKYGTQSSIALLRQHIDYGHWYDQQKLALKNVDDCHYIAALNPTAGSFAVDPRLQRHFSTFAVAMPSATSLMTIYETFLLGHLSNGGFANSVQGIASALIKGALAVHKEVSENFRKTAANFHYEFNIRHLANVFQGLLVATPSNFPEPEKFVCLWLHESERVYGDRLVSYDDLARFKTIMQNQAKKTFMQFNLTRFYISGGGVQPEPLVFCHFADGANAGDDLQYEQGKVLDELRKTLETGLTDYNETHAEMNLVLFDDAVLHVARIVRIVKQTGGHALLVGVGGSGKQSLSKLAAHVCGYALMSISVNPTYTMNDFRADVQAMYSKAGLKMEGVLFLLTDTQIINEKFMIYLNDMLSSGNIPDLYNRDERDGIINSLTNKAKGAGYSSEPSAVWSYFISKIKENLHCCLCFSPVGPSLRTRATRFPALSNCTVIDWFQPWPQQALASVGKSLLAQVPIEDKNIKLAVETYMPLAFGAVNTACAKFEKNEGKNVYTTPKSYLEMNSLYRTLLEKKRALQDQSVHRLENGVEKLVKAAADVVELEANLKIMLESAEEKRTVAAGIAENVSKEKEVVEQENAKAVIEAQKVAAIQSEVAVQQASCAKDLEQAEPALMRAMAALDSLDKRDLGNCKTMSKPPPGVDDIFAAVMVLLAGINPNIIVQKSGKVREKERTWDASKKALLGNVNGFLDELKGFKQIIDEGTVNEMNFKEIRPFMQLEHFSPEIIEKRNSAAAGLCSWVINIVNYYDIVLQVEPKRIALKAANGQLEEANEQLSVVKARVAALQERLDVLTAEFNAAEGQRKEAQDIADKGKLKLELANRLTAALGSEQVRWTEGIDRLKLEKELLVGDCLLAASFISYIGPLSKTYREDLMENTLIPLVFAPPAGAPIPMTPDIETIGLMCDDAEIAQYQTEGLPADRVSAENAAIVTNTTRYPLMIDPQLQAIYWIKRREGEKLVVGRLGQKDLIRRLLKAIEDGDPFIIENMGESIDPTLMPVIGRTTVKRGKRRFIGIGDTEVEFHKDFRMYMHTKLSNPHYPPEIQAECTLVNFSVTELGLEEQLLSRVVGFERPDLASQKSALILQQNLFTIKVKQLEDNILRRLADAQGDITEDRALIEELELSKKISDEIVIKLDESRITSEKIITTSEQYRPVARRGALIFFMMNNLYKVNTYYMFSLNSFIFFFMKGIRTSPYPGEEGVGRAANDDDGDNEDKKQTMDLDTLADEISRRVAEIEERDRLAEASDIPERLRLLMQNVTWVVYDFVRAGLFEKDKLTVMTMLTLKIMVDDGILDKVYVDVLMRGRLADEVANRGEDLAKWLNEVAWARLKGVEEDLMAVDSVFENMSEKVTADAEEWEEWYNQPNPESKDMPGDYKALNEIQKILLLRVFRQDRLPFALTAYIRKQLGDELVTQPPFNMATTYGYTTAATPVLFVLYPGVDPTSWVEDLGKQRDITAANGKFVNISMGQGQEKRADATITKLAESGGWIFLQNVHLMQTWITTLDEKLESLPTVNANFRVFISAEPPPLPYMKNIPEGLLQSCINVSNEPPQDLKANMARAWDAFSQGRIDKAAKKEQFKACLFGLCFFHSVMLGRRRFGSQGWSRAYGFNMGDLRICADVLESYITKDTKVVPYQDIRYIFGEIMYGGHITDFFDRRTNNTYLDVIFNDKLINRGDLAPGLQSPDATSYDYATYTNLISKSLPAESPVIYGMHPNAEVGFLTSKAEGIFEVILRLEVGSADVGTGNVAIVRETLSDILKKCPAKFDLLDLSDRVKLKVEEEDGPYSVVVSQECTRMNSLLEYMTATLEELQKGLNGQLNMSQPMEDIASALGVNEVPGRNPFHQTSWEKLAWPSRKNLASWFADLLLRRTQLSNWFNLVLPFSIWLPGLINPTALLTAIKQVTARKNKLPLDGMSLDTHITRMYRVNNAIQNGVYPEDGVFIHGLLLEGARWTDEEESADDTYAIQGTPCAGHLTESKLKVLLDPMPIIYVKAVPVQPEWSPQAVGYLRGNPDTYECPVYYTSARGHTFVFLSTLKTIDPTHKWTLAGVAILMQSDD
jgi:dynein heavy chain